MNTGLVRGAMQGHSSVVYRPLNLYRRVEIVERKVASCDAVKRTEDEIFAAFQHDQDSFFAEHPRLRPGTAESQIEAVTEDLLARGVPPRLVFELVLAWGQDYTCAGPEHILSAIESVAAKTRAQPGGAA